MRFLSDYFPNLFEEVNHENSLTEPFLRTREGASFFRG
jgi:hypothetical protein